MARCGNCGPGAYPDSVGVHAVESEKNKPWAQWKLLLVGDKIALRSDTGKYLARCHKCWKGNGKKEDGAFIHVSSFSGNPHALWTLVDAGNRKWALKGDNGKYLARCQGCVKGGKKSNFAFVHATEKTFKWAQWTIEKV